MLPGLDYRSCRAFVDPERLHGGFGLICSCSTVDDKYPGLSLIRNVPEFPSFGVLKALRVISSTV